MSDILTKARARNVFYGGSLFFAGVFGLMAWHSHHYIVTQSTAGLPLTEEVVLGKHVWERATAASTATRCTATAPISPPSSAT